MVSLFGFELKRIFQGRHIFLLAIFWGVILYTVYFGAMKYSDFLKEKESFQHFEKSKIKQYISYEQYGFHGFRVLYQPSPLIIFSHSQFMTLKSNVDIKDIINITSNYKGANIFTSSGMEGDFSTIFFVLGSLLMLYFGLNTFTGTASIRFYNSWKYIIATLGARSFILSVYFVLVVLSAFFFVVVLGIDMNKVDTISFFKFSLYLMVFLTLFYILGVLISVALKFRKNLYPCAYLIWFLIIFVFPLLNKMDMERKAKRITSNETVNIEKLQNGKDFERKCEAFFRSLQEKKVKDIKKIALRLIDEYIKKVLPLNTEAEYNLNQEVMQLINRIERKSFLFPSTFYCFLSKEISSMGYYGYQDFFRYLLHLKDKFYRFYIDKRYYQIDQTPESFVTGEENIFSAAGTMPKKYWQGFFSSLIYVFFLLIVLLLGLYRLKKSSRKLVPVNIDLGQLEMGKTYFYLAEDTDPCQKNGLLNYLSSNQAVVVRKPDSSLFDSGMSLKSWVKFVCRLKKYDASLVRENLDLLGISEEHLHLSIKKLEEEVFFATFLALQLAQKSQFFVFDNYLNRVSKSFEAVFKEAVDKLLPHAVIIYIGHQKFDIRLKNNKRTPGSKKNEEGRLVAVNLEDITLR